eukprot:234235-Hanusia_phi.AAC.2
MQVLPCGRHGDAGRGSIELLEDVEWDRRRGGEARHVGAATHGSSNTPIPRELCRELTEPWMSWEEGVDIDVKAEYDPRSLAAPKSSGPYRPAVGWVGGVGGVGKWARVRRREGGKGGRGSGAGAGGALRTRKP